MKYSFEMVIKDKDPKGLFTILAADGFPATLRSNTGLKEHKDSVVCRIEASDIVALKASVSSVLKAVEVYEKTTGLVDGC